MKPSIVTQPVLDEIAASEARPEEDPAPVVCRREFFRLIGAAAVPLAAQGCIGEAGDEWDEFTQLRASDSDITRSIKVLKSLLSQPILNRREELSIDDRFHHLMLGDQCRVVRGNRVALYTVGEVRSEKSSNRVRMSKVARERLGTTDTFSAKLQTAVVAEGLTDEEAKAQSEFVERLVDDGTQAELVVLAPHGGFIEPRTDDQAEYVQAALGGDHSSSWICKGYKLGGGAHDQWHITSTAICRRSFCRLDLIGDRQFKYAVSLHGLNGDVVVIGGRAPESLKVLVRDAIDDALTGLVDVEVSIAGPDDPHSGYSPANLVNWLSKGGEGGIQISQSLEVRNEHWQAVAQAVVDVFAPLVG